MERDLGLQAGPRSQKCFSVEAQCILGSHVGNCSHLHTYLNCSLFFTVLHSLVVQAFLWQVLVCRQVGVVKYNHFSVGSTL